MTTDPTGKNERHPDHHHEPAGDVGSESMTSEAGGEMAAERETDRDARTWAIACHLAGLGGYVLPVAGSIIGPLVIWMIKREQFPFVDHQGKEALNFQISIVIYATICLALVFCVVGPFLLGAVGVFQVVMVVVASIKANDGYRFRYPLTIRLVK